MLPVRSSATDLLECLQVIEEELSLPPESVLRPLFDAFRLEVRHSRPANYCVIRVTISDDSLDSLVAAIGQNGKESTEDGVLHLPFPMLSVHPAFHNTNLVPLIDGPLLQLTGNHGKVRRSGYGTVHGAS